MAGLNALRQWIVDELTVRGPFKAPKTFWSDDSDPTVFKSWTGVSQNDLLDAWQGPKDKDGNRSGKGPDPTFTTCSSFLARFATRVRQGGGMALKTINKQGFINPVKLGSFELQKEIGWKTTGSPQIGDFFQCAQDGYTLHVGVIVEMSGGSWGKVAGGAAGKSKGHDGVKRTPLEPKPGDLMGWLNVDEYFAGWAGPGAPADAIYDQRELRTEVR